MDLRLSDERKERLRRQTLVLVRVGLVGGAFVAIAAFSAYLTVRNSVSGRDVAVPDLAALTSDEATAILGRSGLTLEEAAQRNDPVVEAGRILAQDPPPGSRIKTGRKVKVVLSLGDTMLTVPDLRGGAARKAQITLQQQGIRLGDQIYVFAPRIDENLVVAQDPPPEGARQHDGKVSLLISRGRTPRAYVMPDLTGRTEAEVAAFLARAGLRPGPIRRAPDRGEPRGTVVSQTPEAGFPVRGGDLVTVTLAGEERAGG